MENTQTIEAPKPELRSLTEEAEHVHQFRRVPKSQRTDRLTFVCTLYRCVCGEEMTY
jgi:hypothetical protein